MVTEPVYHTLGNKLDEPPRRYILPWAAGCVTCAQHMSGEMMPPHDPSPRCESGKRSHCTCDVCF
jgi:hypothetical protein